MKLPNLLRITWCLMFLSALSYPNAAAGYAIRAVALGTSLVIVLYCFTRGGICFYKNDQFTLMFVAYMTVAFLSAIMSNAPWVSILKCLELLCDFLLVYIFYWYEKQGKPQYSIKKCLSDWTGLALIVILIIWIGYFANSPLFSSSSGGLISKQLGANTLISSNAIGCIATAIVIKYITNQKIKFKWIILTLMAVTIIFTMSRTALLIILIVLVTYVLISKFRFLYLLLGIAAVFATFHFYDTIESFILRGQSAETFKSLSGRTVMWEQVLKLSKESPIIGYGFGVGSDLIVLDDVRMESVHNGFFEVLLDMGYLGLIVFVLLILIFLFVLARRIALNGMREARYSVLIHIYLLIRTMSSLGMGGWHTLDVMLFLAIVYDDMNAINRTRKMYAK